MPRASSARRAFGAPGFSPPIAVESQHGDATLHQLLAQAWTEWLARVDLADPKPIDGTKVHVP
jgi:hypothetical protein